MTSFAANNARQSAYREEREYEPAPKRPAESYQTEQRSRSFGGNDYDENEEDFRPQYQSTREEPRQSAAQRNGFFSFKHDNQEDDDIDFEMPAISRRQSRNK